MKWKRLAHLLTSDCVRDVYSTLGICGHIRRHNLVVVEPNAEMQVWVKVHAGALDGFSKQKLFVGDFADVSPHRKLINEHLEEIVVLDGILELLQLQYSIHHKEDKSKYMWFRDTYLTTYIVQIHVFLAQRSPWHWVHEGQIVGGQHFP
jgi:hypothetical protein